jgi:hypothetical protein
MPLRCCCCNTLDPINGDLSTLLFTWMTVFEDEAGSNLAK